VTVDLSIRGLSSREQFDKFLLEQPEYCSCSCHVGVHDFQRGPDGLGRITMRCRERYHRCDPVVQVTDEVLTVLRRHFAKNQGR
jgi:hypothetical protein